MSISPFFKALVNQNIPIKYVEELDQVWGDQDPIDWLDGAEIIAEIMVLEEKPGLAVPTCEPWQTFHSILSEEIRNGKNHTEAYAMALESIPPAYHISTASAVNTLMAVIQERENEKGKRRRIHSDEYIKALRKLGYSFSKNVCTDRILVNGEYLTDDLAATIRKHMRNDGFLQTSVMEDAYISEARERKFHPIKDFLTSLSWDGGNYIEQTCQYFHDQYGMFPIYFRKFLIGAVAKVFESAQNPMLVLDGPQGLGKSEFTKWLCGYYQNLEIYDYYVESAINTDDKDMEARAAASFIWEVSELGITIKRADIESLKAFLSKRKIVVRKPYDKYDTIKPALASFVGTVNNISGILNDPTGSRRFRISKLARIDWEYSKIDIRSVWAEAMAAYLGKESWDLSSTEKDAANEINELYMVEDPVEGMVLKHFTIDPNNKTWWMPTIDIIKTLEFEGLKGHTRSNAMIISGILVKLGLEKCRRLGTNGQRYWGYAGIKPYP